MRRRVWPAARTIRPLDARGTPDDGQGKLLTTYPTSVAGGRSSAFVLSTLPGLDKADLGSGHVRITSSQPVAGFALFATHDNSVVSAIPSRAMVK
jgi:hypothetical protein